jgi:glycosyltransferase involved in cell wall biosynthesis
LSLVARLAPLKKLREMGYFMKKEHLEEFVSVLVPVYNVEPYLHRCIDSILEQTYKNFEIILVDDGSTDGSPLICEEYEQKYENITFIPAEHLGVSNARNILLQNAKGQYICFVDSDDFISKHTLQLSYEVMKSTGSQIVQFAMLRTNDNTIREDYNTYMEAWDKALVYGSKDAVWGFQSSKTPLRCMLAGKMYEKKVFNGITFPVGKIHEDEFTMHRIINNCRRIAYFPAKLYYYYHNQNSIMKKGFGYEKYDVLDAIEDRITFYREMGLYEHAEVNMLRYCFHTLDLYRQTAKHFPEDTEKLCFLMEKYKGRVKDIFHLNIINEDLRQNLAAWMDDPLKGELFNYWAYIGKLEYEGEAK